MSEILTMTLRLSAETHKIIATKAKQFGLSQGELIELLVDQAGEQLDVQLAQAKENKAAARAAIKKLSKLRPDQLAKLMDASK